MNKSDQAPGSIPESRTKTIVVVAIAVFCLAYLFLRPVLNQQFGWNLPELNQAEQPPADDRESVTNQDEQKPGPDRRQEKSPSADARSKDDLANATDKSLKNGDSKPQRPVKRSNDNRPRGPPKSPNAGQLTEISRDTWKSTAGLIYGPGSRDGHRLKHVMKHREDDLSKPVHGVFDGSEAEVLALIDEAFEKAKRGGRGVRKQDQGKRTVYTVQLNRRIGYVGGRRGKEQNLPEARELSLVVEGDRVITAYPR